MDSTTSFIARATQLAPLFALSLVLAVPAVQADEPDNERPSASFTISPSNPVTGEQVTFSSTSTDPDGQITGQWWDLDNDGSYDDSTATSATKVFASPGRKTVRLRVEDDDGATRSVSRAFMVSDPKPEEDEGEETAPPASSPPPATFPAPVVNGPAPPQPTLIGPRLLNPFPLVRIRGVTTRRGARLDLLSVRTTGGTKILARCTGRGCPWARRTSRPRFSATRLRAVKMPGFTRRHLRAGTVLEVFVTKRGRIGKYTRFRIRRLKAPARTDSCTAPGRARVRRCPA